MNQATCIIGQKQLQTQNRPEPKYYPCDKIFLDMYQTFFMKNLKII